MERVSTMLSPSVNLRLLAVTIFFSLNFGSSATSVDFLDPVMSPDKWETLISLSALPAPHTLLLYTLSQVLSTYSRRKFMRGGSQPEYFKCMQEHVSPFS